MSKKSNKKVIDLTEPTPPTSSSSSSTAAPAPSKTSKKRSAKQADLPETAPAQPKPKTVKTAPALAPKAFAVIEGTETPYERRSTSKKVYNTLEEANKYIMDQWNTWLEDYDGFETFELYKDDNGFLRFYREDQEGTVNEIYSSVDQSWKLVKDQDMLAEERGEKDERGGYGYGASAW
ncbi:hypothetical protein HDU76_008275 [Blyttiomyces sp. JEL0837]|nr:hypothetical protein HDU76_008275 [Blyttiomyces sp. JEL0837]